MRQLRRIFKKNQAKSQRYNQNALALELLEDRLLLSVDIPGLQLVDPAIDYFDGQVIYLDFDGQDDVTYNGPVTVEGIDVTPFTIASGDLVGMEEAVIIDVTEQLNDRFSEAGVTFTAEKPDDSIAYSTVYVGGNDSAFQDYGRFYGLAEKVDIGNNDPADNAFVFSENLSVDTEYVSELTSLVEHETGHLLGYEHQWDTSDSNPLLDVAETGTLYEHPWYGEEAIGDGEGFDGRAIWEIDTSGAPSGATITDVDVWYEIQHTYIGDLKVWLTTEVSPGVWRDYFLWDREGGSANNIEEQESGIDYWDGYSPNRTWYLCAADYATPDSGHIEEWKIWVHWYKEDPKPDLYTSSGPTVSDSTVYPGQSITVNWTARNGGNGSAGSSQQGIMWSSNSTISRSDSLLEKEYVGSLGPGSSTPEAHTITIPSNATPGSTYYIGIYQDYDLSISESNESNNASSGVAVTILDPRPDLYTSSGPTVSDSTVYPGQSITVNWTARNGGNGSAGSSQQGIMWSTDNSISRNDALLEKEYVGILGSGSSTPEAHTITIPTNATIGSTYYIGIYQDYDLSISESNESNNASPGVAVTILDPRPDLYTSSGPTVSDSTVYPGQSITVNWTARNGGNGSAGSSQQGIMWSTDNSISRNDTLLAKEFVGILGSDSSTPEAHTITIPSNATIGSTYYIGIYQDYDLQISESNESNNSSSSVAITIIGPDLIVSSVTGTGTSYYTGQSIHATANIRNQGQGYASSSNLRYYLGTSDGTNKTYRYIEQGSVESLNYNEEDSDMINLGWTIPSDVSNGNYRIWVLADSDNNVYESNENNNWGYSNSFTIETAKPDVIVTDILMDGNSTLQPVMSGESVRLDFDVKNQGNATTQAGVHMKWWWGTSQGAMTHEIATGELGSINGLSPGEIERETDASWTIPDLAEGTYWITAMIDWDDRVDELIETNNVRSESFTVYELFVPEFNDVRIPESSKTDVDQDGFARSFNIEFDVNSNKLGNYYIKVFEDDFVGDDPILTSSTFSVNGTSVDYHSVTIICDNYNLYHGTAEFRLDLYDAATNTVIETWTASDDPNLGNVQVELSSEDQDFIPTIAQATLSGVTDKDGDDKFSRLKVAFDVNSNMAGQVYAQICDNDLASFDEVIIQTPAFSVNGSVVDWKEYIFDVESSWFELLDTADIYITLFDVSNNDEVDRFDLDTIEAELTVDDNTAPTIPGDPWAADITHTTATVHWGASIDHEDDDITYTVQWKTDGAFTWPDENTLTTTNTYINITDLAPGTVYDVHIKASDGQLESDWNGWWDTSEENVITTLPIIPAFISNFQIETIDTDDDGFASELIFRVTVSGADTGITGGHILIEEDDLIFDDYIGNFPQTITVAPGESQTYSAKVSVASHEKLWGDGIEGYLPYRDSEFEFIARLSDSTDDVIFSYPLESSHYKLEILDGEYDQHLSTPFDFVKNNEYEAYWNQFGGKAVLTIGGEFDIAVDTLVKWIMGVGTAGVAAPIAQAIDSMVTLDAGVSLMTQIDLADLAGHSLDSNFEDNDLSNDWITIWQTGGIGITSGIEASLDNLLDLPFGLSLTCGITTLESESWEYDPIINNLQGSLSTTAKTQLFNWEESATVGVNGTLSGEGITITPDVSADIGLISSFTPGNSIHVGTSTLTPAEVSLTSTATGGFAVTYEVRADVFYGYIKSCFYGIPSLFLHDMDILIPNELTNPFDQNFGTILADAYTQNFDVNNYIRNATEYPYQLPIEDLPTYVGPVGFAGNGRAEQGIEYIPRHGWATSSGSAIEDSTISWYDTDWNLINEIVYEGSNTFNLDGSQYNVEHIGDIAYADGYIYTPMQLEDINDADNVLDYEYIARFDQYGMLDQSWGIQLLPDIISVSGVDVYDDMIWASGYIESATYHSWDTAPILSFNVSDGDGIVSYTNSNEIDSYYVNIPYMNGIEIIEKDQTDYACITFGGSSLDVKAPIGVSLGFTGPGALAVIPLDELRSKFSPFAPLELECDDYYTYMSRPHAEGLTFNKNGELWISWGNYVAQLDINNINWSSPEIDVQIPLQVSGNIHSQNLGTVTINDSASGLFTVHNTGTAPLRVEELSGLTSPFTVLPVNLPGEEDDWIIMPGESYNFTVTFAPTYEGNYNSTLVIVNNDRDESNYSITLSGIAVSDEPVLSSLYDAPDPVIRGEFLSLTASANPASTNSIDYVEFYLDTNGNTLYEEGIDEYLGMDMDPDNGWSWQGSTMNFSLGEHIYMARAYDTEGNWSNTVWNQGVIVNALPTVGSLSVNPDPVILGQEITLSASGINDSDGSVINVVFYRDANHNSLLDDNDSVLGNGSNDGSNWLWTGITSDFEIGQNLYFVQVQDNDNAWSSIVSTTGIVLPDNQPPTEIILSNNTIEENLPAGSDIGQLSTIDPDIDDIFIYQFIAGIGDDDNALFAIENNMLRSLQSFNYESKSEYSIRIRSTDQGGLYIDTILTINIIDVEENGPQIVQWESVKSHGYGVGDSSLIISDDDSFSEPRIEAGTIEGGLSRLVITFNQAIDPISFDPSGIIVSGNTVDNAEVDLSGITISTTLREGNSIGEIQFSPALPDMGRYYVRIDGVTDDQGTPLEGDNDRIMTVLLGDVNGDLRVNNTDIGGVMSLRGINPIDINDIMQIRSDANLDGRINNTDVGGITLLRGRDLSYVSNPMIIMPEETQAAPSVITESPAGSASEADVPLADSNNNTILDVKEDKKEIIVNPPISMVVDQILTETTSPTQMDDSAIIKGTNPFTLPERIQLGHIRQISRIRERIIYNRIMPSPIASNGIDLTELNIKQLSSSRPYSQISVDRIDSLFLTSDHIGDSYGIRSRFISKR